jgi:WD40 repeat protein/transcriptional regulator with XRE-family HTH domain
MNRALYGERDYAFGQRILTLRTQLGLTQTDLAERLHISRRAVTEWEAGSSYPTAQHLQELIVLGAQASAFPAGREAEEIRALWQAAHQKVLLDDVWLVDLLGRTRPALTLLPPVSHEAPRPHIWSAAQVTPGPRLNWQEALDVPTFYGRELELATLARWVVEDGCRMVGVLGMGGIGKSALVARAVQQLAEHFDVVLFHSLRDAPDCAALLESCLAVLAPEQQTLVPQSLEQRLRLLLEELRSRRVLLVLDNLETLLSESEVLGRLRPGYEGYGQLLEQIAHTAHQSCLLLTSREKPAALRALESRRAFVRSLRLSGLAAEDCAQLLAAHEVIGSPEEHAQLREMYAGNPLALNIVAETIVDLFGGEIEPFLSGGTIIFGSITVLLEEQWARISPLEQMVLCWLATLREPVSIAEMLAMLVDPLSHGQVLEAVDGLRRRSLIERGQRAGSFTLQSVMLEYVTGRLIATVSEEIQQGRLLRLREHSLSQAQAKDYVRQTQERLLLAPLLARLQGLYHGRAAVERQLQVVLDALRGQAEEVQGYGPANLVALLRLLRGHLRGLDLSHLALRGAYLQDVEMQDARLTGTLMRECVFREAFDVITALAISRSGQYWAAISRRGEVRVWNGVGQRLHLAWQAHTENTFALAFSPDERLLATGSHDGSVKLWEVASGTLIWSGWQTKATICLAFSPDGRLLAGGGHDTTVRIWDARLGIPLEEVSHPGPVIALAWSPDGRLFASGDLEGKIRLWERQETGPTTCVAILEGHTQRVRGLSFAPSGSRLASASYDGTIRLWEIGEVSGYRLRQTLVGHTKGVETLAWSPDGGTLASGSQDRTIRLWEAEQPSAQAVLQGHRATVYGLAFTPDSCYLLSGSEDGSLRTWEAESGESLRVMQGFTLPFYDLAWSPDGTHLATAGMDSQVTLWEANDSTAPRVLGGHLGSAYGVGWSPDGRRLASCGLDRCIRLWDPTTGICVQVLRDRDLDDTGFDDTGFSVAWSPDGHALAIGTLLQGVRIWDVTTGFQRGADRTQASSIRQVAWSSNGRRLVGVGEDGHVYVWDARGDTLLFRLEGHHGIVMSVAWSLDDRWVATGSGSRDRGELFVWDAHSGERIRALVGHPGVISALSWAPSSDRVVSGGSDGKLRWWDVQSGECVRVQEAHQGMVRSLKLSPDASILASCGDDGAIVFWDVQSGEALRRRRRDRPYERLTITGVRGLTPAQLASLRELGAIGDADGISFSHA